MSGHTITVPAGEVRKLVGLEVDFVQLYRGPSTGIFVSINSESSFVWFVQGIGYQRGAASPINTVFFENRGSVSAELQIITGNGAMIDSRGAVFGTTTQAKPASANALADVAVAATTTVQVAAATATRVAVILSNLVANGSPVRYGDGAATGQGAELPVGASVSLPTVGAVDVYNPSGTSVSIGVTEVLD